MTKRIRALRFTYAEIAAKLGIGHCVRCDAWAGKHYPGLVIREGPEIVAHWSERRVNRRGAFNFVRQVEMVRAPLGAPLWLRIYLSTSRAVDAAAAIGYRIPRWYSDHERRRVRYLLRDHEMRNTNEDARRAWKWAAPE